MKKSHNVLSEPLLQNTDIPRQIQTEVQSIELGIDRYRKICKDAKKRNDGAKLKPAERLCMYWFEPLEAAIQKEIDEYKKNLPGKNRAIVGPIMAQIRADKMALIVMHEAIGACMNDSQLYTVVDRQHGENEYRSGVKYAGITYAIGRSVLAEIYLALAKKTEREAYVAFMRTLKHSNVTHVNWWAKKTLDCERTSRTALTMLGDVLLSLLAEVATCSESHDEEFKPAFFHEIINVGGKDIGFFGMTDECVRIIDDGHAIRERLRPRYLPMLIEPLAWQEKNADRPRAEGGYVKIRTPLISKITKSQKQYVNSADLTMVFEALNSVCSTGMKINKRILGVVQEVWRRGGGCLGLPPLSNDPLPQCPENYKQLPDEERKRWRLSCCQVHRRNIEYKSRRKQIVTTISIAEQFENEPVIYFPHQMDYRGRCYPIPQPLNHQGMDHHVAMLSFSNGIEAPLRELFIHASNCYGNDKVSYDEREAWGHDNLKEMLACAADPMGTDMWHKADKPFQFLAACMALMHPEDAAHLPISSDGTCNGLQHYAAMLRDERLASLVNLRADSRPQSIYTVVTEEVVRRVRADINRGTGKHIKYMKEENTAASMELCDLAKMALPFAVRKVVKQPVMTDLYGVTLTGARLQVQGELVKLASIPKPFRYPIAFYLANVILSSIGEVCSSARDAMKWIRGCTKKIVELDRPLTWQSELGLPIVQPHRNKNKVKIETLMQMITLAIDDCSLPVHRRGQVDASAPNVLHSLDSTHMLMTSMACVKRKIDFMATHDRFFSHAATKTDASRINREQFVSLHREPYLPKLFAQWRKNHPDIKFDPCPSTGSFDINEVLTSPYFFN